MDVAIVGAGPTGLVMAAALARRGHAIDIIDRDGGPRADGAWERKGVMQFHHAHAVRPHVAHTLLAELSEAYEKWLAAGAEPVYAETPSDRVLFPSGRAAQRSSERSRQRSKTCRVCDSMSPMLPALQRSTVAPRVSW